MFEASTSFLSHHFTELITCIRIISFDVTKYAQPAIPKLNTTNFNPKRRGLKLHF